MNLLRRSLFPLVAGAMLALAGCGTTPTAVDPAVRQALAPTGTLRVGVYPGSPSSTVIDPRTGEKVGVALKLGQTLGARLGVPVKIVEFERLALVLEAVKNGTADITFTNATDIRARDVDFTPPLIQLELGYLVPPASAIRQASDVDRPGVRVGVSQGSSSQGVLGKQFQHASLVPAASLSQAKELLRQGKVEAYATNKAILFELSDDLPNYRVLEGRWGLENVALAIPKGRGTAMPYLRQFALDVRANGQLQAFVLQAGLRGVARND